MAKKTTGLERIAFDVKIKNLLFSRQIQHHGRILLAHPVDK